MSVAAAWRKAAEARCARRMRSAGAAWGRATWLRDNDMPGGAWVAEELARDEEQRAEAELRRGHRQDAELVLRDDYEARLVDYIDRLMSRYGPLAEVVDPDRFIGQMWVGSSAVRRLPVGAEQDGPDR